MVVVYLLQVFLTLQFSLPNSAASEVLSKSHECEDHPEKYVQKVLALTTQLICRHRSDEDCRLMAATDKTIAGAAGRAVAVAKAVALNRSFAPPEAPVKCRASETYQGAHPAEVMLSPFLNILQLFLAAHPGGKVRTSCPTNPVGYDLLKGVAATTLMRLEKQLKSVRDPSQQSHLNHNIGKIKASLTSLQVGSLRGASSHVPNQNGLRTVSDEAEQLSQQLSDADMASGPFRRVADGLGFIETPWHLRRSARAGLQMLARMSVIEATPLPGSASTSLPQASGEDTCQSTSSMYGHVDENCKYRFVLDRKFELLVTAPVETQLYELSRFPQLCSLVNQAFEDGVGQQTAADL